MRFLAPRKGVFFAFACYSNTSRQGPALRRCPNCFKKLINQTYKFLVSSPTRREHRIFFPFSFLFDKTPKFPSRLLFSQPRAYQFAVQLFLCGVRLTQATDPPRYIRSQHRRQNRSCDVIKALSRGQQEFPSVANRQAQIPDESKASQPKGAIGKNGGICGKIALSPERLALQKRKTKKPCSAQSTQAVKQDSTSFRANDEWLLG